MAAPKKKIFSHVKIFSVIIIFLLSLLLMFFPYFFYPSKTKMGIIFFFAIIAVITLFVKVKDNIEYEPPKLFGTIPLTLKKSFITVLFPIILSVWLADRSDNYLNHHEIQINLNKIHDCFMNDFADSLKIIVNNGIELNQSSYFYLPSSKPKIKIPIDDVYRGTKNVNLILKFSKQWDCFYIDTLFFDIGYFDFNKKIIESEFIVDRKNLNKSCKKLESEFLNHIDEAILFFQNPPISDEKKKEIIAKGDILLKEYGNASKQCSYNKIVSIKISWEQIKGILNK